MTLSQKIQLIDDLIRENPDVTIKDYRKAINEMDRIDSAFFLMKTTDINKFKISDLMCIGGYRKIGLFIK